MSETRKKPEDLRSARWFAPDDLRAFGHRSRAMQMGLAPEDWVGKPVIASVAGLCEDDFYTIATTINASKPDLVEVNLSCPNIPGKPQIGYDPDTSERVIKRVRSLITVPMGLKLPPYFDPAHHEVMGKVIGRHGVDFLNMINSVGNGLVVDPDREAVVIKPKGGFGGLGGRIIKPVALANDVELERNAAGKRVGQPREHGDEHREEQQRGAEVLLLHHDEDGRSPGQQERTEVARGREVEPADAPGAAA